MYRHKYSADELDRSAVLLAYNQSLSELAVYKQCHEFNRLLQTADLSKVTSQLLSLPCLATSSMQTITVDVLTDVKQCLEKISVRHAKIHSPAIRRKHLQLSYLTMILAISG